MADRDQAAERLVADVHVTEAGGGVTRGEVLLHLVAPAERLALQGQARAAELRGTGGVGEVAVECIRVEVDAPTERCLEFAVGRSQLHAAFGLDLGRAGGQLVQHPCVVEVDVRLCIGAGFQLGQLRLHRLQLRFEIGQFAITIGGGTLGDRGEADAAANGQDNRGSQD